MSTLPVSTSRKRKQADVLNTPQSSRKRRTASNLPTPNPPLAPFPTPRTSRRRAAATPSDIPPDHYELDEDLDHDPTEHTKKPTVTLPAHLQTLLTLHHAFNVALSLHIATNPPVLPPHAPDATRVQLPNLTNLTALKATVERTSGRRFGEQELARLAWLWCWDGESLGEERSSPVDLSEAGPSIAGAAKAGPSKEADENPFLVSTPKGKATALPDDETESTPKAAPSTPGSSRKTDDNPFLVAGSSSPSKSLRSPKTTDDNPFHVGSTPQKASVVSGLSYVITPTRTIELRTGRKVYTHGLGIELELQPGETRQVLLGGSLGGIGNNGQHGGTGVIGRWTSGGELRKDEVARRLHRWVELHGGIEETQAEQTQLPTPSTHEHEREARRSAIPPIPLKELPRLGPVVSGLFASPMSSDAGMRTPRRNLASALVAASDDTTPTSSPAKPASSAPSTPSSLEQRRQAMVERIKARSAASAAKRPTLASSLKPGVLHTLTQSMQAESLKRRSTLSRLEGIAETIWMMFSTSSGPSTSSVPGTPRGPRTRKAIPLAEMADTLVKSSKSPISLAEAQGSIRLLADLCPFFVLIKVVGTAEWVEMPPAVLAQSLSPGAALQSLSASGYAAPGQSLHMSSSSPGSALVSGTLEQPLTLSPSQALSPAQTLSPSAALTAEDNTLSVPPAFASPTSSPRRRTGGVTSIELSGPASPGRVRRGGGLREVRERIRRELEK